MTTMQERAANVAEAKATIHEDNAKGWREDGYDGEKHSAAHDACAQTAHAIAARIRALPADPDPTRAALEECVRAMEPLAKMAKYTSHRHLGYTVGVPVETLRAIEKAYATARKSLQGE